MAEITIESLQIELKDALEKIDSLTSELKKSEEAVKLEKKVNSDFEEVIKTLQSKISEQEALLPKVYTVTIKSKTYVVTGGVRTPDGRILSAEEVAADKEVCAWLLFIESPILTEKK